MSVPVARAAIATADAFSIAATTNDPSGVTWSVAPAAGTSASNAGTFSPTTTTNGASAAYTSKGPGVFTVTATSVTDTTKAASFTLYVTDLAGVYTYHDDLNRDGANTQEYALTPQNVQSHFGKLFSCPVDGAIYAQPLWVAGVSIGGAQHNVVYVATEHDGLWAFDADANPCQKLWSVSLIDPAHGANAGETSVPSGAKGSPEGFLVGLGNGDMAPEVGVTGTPVIAPGTTAGTGTLYVVSKSVSADGKTFYQRLHAINITTGAEAIGSPAAPVTILATTTSQKGSTDTFSAQVQNQRPALALVNGTVYIAWSSHEDAGQYYGWVIGYNAATLQQSLVFNDVPNNTSTNGYGAGIWMSGGGPAADSTGNLYLITGNGPFDANATTTPNNDYGDSLIKLAVANSNLSVADYFTPSDQADDDTGDNDFGASGATILADLPNPVTINGVAVTHLLVGGDEKGRLYVLNRDKLGGYTGTNSGVIQQVNAGSETTGGKNNGALYATGAYWNGTFYIIAAGQKSQLQAWPLSLTTAQLPASPTSYATGFGFPSGTPSVSAQGTTNGVVWALDDSQYCTPESPGCSAAVLHAYDATNLGTQLYSSSTVATDAAGYPVKFTLPTVANGKVYVGTRGNNTGGADTTTSVPGELDVYGLTAN